MILLSERNIVLILINILESEVDMELNNICDFKNPIKNF